MGHENTYDKKRLEELKEIVSNTNSVKHLIELAQLYVEPFHMEDKAIDILSKVLIRDPQNSLAKIILTYCHIHYSMSKESLITSEKLLRSIIDSELDYKGAAYMLLAEVLDDLNAISVNETITMLRNSVKFEPDWVFNHHRLAWAYHSLGQRSNAIREIKTAIDNIREGDELNKNFIDENIAGKYCPKNLLKEEYDRISASN